MTPDNKDKSDRDIMAVNSEPSFTASGKPERPVLEGNEGSYFLNKFLDGDTSNNLTDDLDEPVAEIVPHPDADAFKKNIANALREIYDPEIPVNIYEMGLIYGVEVNADAIANVTMTLTTPHCPVAESMPGEVELKVKSVAGIKDASVQLVWEPPWDMSMMSDEARLELGML